jgi:hypothetical protein
VIIFETIANTLACLPQNEQIVKSHYMSVNSNPTASQQNKKKLPVSKFFQFFAGAVDTGDQPLLLNVSLNCFKNSK